MIILTCSALNVVSVAKVFLLLVNVVVIHCSREITGSSILHWFFYIGITWATVQNDEM